MTPPKLPPHIPKSIGSTVQTMLMSVVADERDACAKLADDYGDRLTQSGKADEAMVAITLAAQIRARK